MENYSQKEALQLKLAQAYADYVELLVAEINDLIPLAYVHGWKSSRVAQGEAARAKIQECLENLSKCS